MNSTQHQHVDMKLEVDIIPVADVDRSKKFYGELGWRLDADFAKGDWRAVQMTPPGSPTSIIFGKGVTTVPPGSVRGFLVVDDVEAAREDLVSHGVDVSEVFHFEGKLTVDNPEDRVPGKDPEGRSYSSYASFTDPDGNKWMLQEITSRLPGRGFGSDVPTMTELLREAEQRHGAYEKSAPKHHWSSWYAAYIVAREQGSTPEQAADAAAHHLESPQH
jgi:predicted enzyme related to lactoylglutathione lyase